MRDAILEGVHVDPKLYDPDYIRKIPPTVVMPVRTHKRKISNHANIVKIMKDMGAIVKEVQLEKLPTLKQVSQPVLKEFTQCSKLKQFLMVTFFLGCMELPLHICSGCQIQLLWWNCFHIQVTLFCNHLLGRPRYKYEYENLAKLMNLNRFIYWMNTHNESVCFECAPAYESNSMMSMDNAVNEIEFQAVFTKALSFFKQIK